MGADRGRVAAAIAALVMSASTAVHADDRKAQVDAIYPDVEKLYIDLHRNPELAFHEKRTAATLAARVKALGFTVATGVGGTGVVGLHAGYFRAAATGRAMTVFGTGGHGAYPQTAIDPVVISARIILALQTIVSREVAPGEPAVVTVGSIHGGAESNILPEQVKLEITVRSLTPELHKRLLAAIAREAKGEAQAANAPRAPLIETKSHTDAVYNDPELTKRVVAAASAVLG